MRHALEPIFDRLGADAKPDDILALKVCDPAMGSGAFLVEACRQLAQRLAQAWARWPESRPTVPADEDDELHAKRLVAQRCLYGVDKNPMATDLARLSLWLVTLARDHEFTFLDHALKSGDSLVGLVRTQIGAAHWDMSRPPALFQGLIKARVDEVLGARDEIRSAPDDVARAIQEGRHKLAEERLDQIRLMGDALIAAFFSSAKVKEREARRIALQDAIAGGTDALSKHLHAARTSLRLASPAISPFHWEIEFPEAFTRARYGFDAVVGNPPFLGGKKISAQLGDSYRDWLFLSHSGANKNTDLAGHFFLSSFAIMNREGSFGLVATNRISQGDTRAGALETIIRSGGVIYRAVTSFRWPGEADVVVSAVHARAKQDRLSVLNGRPVRRISSYLVEGEFDDSPAVLASNDGLSFIGSYVLGMGFTFDRNGVDGTNSLDLMREIIARDANYAARIHRFVGAEELYGDPTHHGQRFVFNLSDVSEQEARERWPRLLRIAEERVKPERAKKKRPVYRNKWWRFAEPQSALYEAIGTKTHVLATSAAAAMHHMIARIASGVVFSHKLCVFAFDGFGPFAVLQSGVHETWSRFFGTTFGSVDALTYNPTQVFRTFPFPAAYFESHALAEAGRKYHDHRAAMMDSRAEGLTKIYNRFHDKAEASSDVVQLRELHDAIDREVIAAYGWDDIAEKQCAQFEDVLGQTVRTRRAWPGDFRDEVFARLLSLNAERAQQERRAGLVAVSSDDVQDDTEEA